MEKKNRKSRMERIKDKGIDIKLLEKYFSIDKIKEDSIVESTISVVWNKIEEYTDILEDIVNPEGDPILLFEIEGLNSDEKRTAWKILKDLMKLKREKELAEIENKEDEKIKIINKILKSWDEKTEHIKKILRKMAETWESEKGDENKMSYLG